MIDISISLNAKYVEMIVFCKHTAVTWHEKFQFSYILYPLKYTPGPCGVNIFQKKQHHFKRRTPMVYNVTAYFIPSKYWNENKGTYYQTSPRFFMFSLQKNTIMPKYISISDKSILFDGCPTPKLGKNKPQALQRFQRYGFRKVWSKCCLMWQVFGPWANPYWINGQITMTMHNYRSRQVHETLHGVHPSSGFRDMRSAKSGPILWQIWQVFGPWARTYRKKGQMTMTVHN